MKYTINICQLSNRFYDEYSLQQYPEILRKSERPYTCLLIETHEDYFICIPFRSSIQHNEAFLFDNTSRSKHSRSGLDYKKAVIINDLGYIDTSSQAVVDNDEYSAMMVNIETIVNEISTYITTYINHISGACTLHRREFLRHYQYSTLPYFHDILGIK